MLLAGITACSQDKKEIGVVAHRGYWQCEDGGMARNSIASLTSAQKQGFWGSECDIHVSADDTVFVWHDAKIEGRRVQQMTFAELSEVVLANGERIPTLEQYLQAYNDNAAAFGTSTRLIIEIKKHKDPAREELCIDKMYEFLKAYKLYDPAKIVFISFSLKACQKISSDCPGFTVQYLEKDLTPAEVKNSGVGGMDIHFQALRDNPSWTGEAHALGMSMNSWTASEEDQILDMIAQGVDQITSDRPDLVREILAREGIKEAK